MFAVFQVLDDWTLVPIKAILIKFKFKTNKMLFYTTNKHELNHKTVITTHHIPTFRVLEINIIKNHNLFLNV